MAATPPCPQTPPPLQHAAAQERFAGIGGPQPRTLSPPLQGDQAAALQALMAALQGVGVVDALPQAPGASAEHVAQLLSLSPEQLAQAVAQARLAQPLFWQLPLDTVPCVVWLPLLRSASM